MRWDTSRTRDLKGVMRKEAFWGHDVCKGCEEYVGIGSWGYTEDMVWMIHSHPWKDIEQKKL
jgi:hypothetical protein